ncbi:hypothetical protein CCH79_00003393 [Gambusia affinis]|uniref:Sulfotransferase n=1 Tax=Gambusia affinis TaxID=33528 RepID=A0A315VES7_GAMAF|nr:hypothetical protein CCH79_00003393 [Gambusia affinis]
MLNQSCACSAGRPGVWQVCWQMSLSLQPVLQGLWSHLQLNETHLLGFGVETEEQSAGWDQEETLCICICVHLHVGQGYDALSMMPKALDGQIVMEKTPRYFVTVDTPARVHAMSQDVKLIVVVRDPVTRAISDYTQIISKTPNIPSFETLAFKNRTTGQIDSLWSPLWIGLYAQHMERWLAWFPRNQIHLVSGERLISDPAGELGKVQDFLGLQRIVTDKHFYFNKTKGFPCLKKPEGSSKPHCLGKTKGRTHVSIDPEVIRKLRDFYKPHNQRFYQLAGQNFGWH